MTPRSSPWRAGTRSSISSCCPADTWCQRETPTIPSDLHHSVARFNNTGELPWSDAVLIDTQTDDGSDVADEKFDAEYLVVFTGDSPNPTILIVEQRFDSDLKTAMGT
ncbi:MAG: hypothetical protein VKI81_12090 [Synechococcaceae cyanobacterium]|nr:hypothetical protein [Synechococcaceae cyanobacterium]